MRRLMLTAVASLPIAFGLAACGSPSDSGTASNDVTVHTEAPETYETPEPVASATDAEEEAEPIYSAVGDTATWAAVTQRVAKYDTDVPPAEAAEAGMRWDAIKVRSCNEGVEDEITRLTMFSSSAWVLEDAEGGQFTASGVTYRQSPTPDYPGEKDLPTGECVAGWIIFDVPSDFEGVRAVWSLDETPVGYWSLD